MPRLLIAALATLVTASEASAQSSRWVGSWVSDTSGHSGPLHARVRPVDDHTYRAAFRGRFFGVIPFWYTTKLYVEGSGDGVLVLGASQRLPLVGEYRTTAVVTPDTFDARFTSRGDSGRFVLRRR